MSWKIYVSTKPNANAEGPDWAVVTDPKKLRWYITWLPNEKEKVRVGMKVCLFGSKEMALIFTKKSDATTLVTQLQIAGCHGICACRDNGAVMELELEECV